MKEVIGLIAFVILAVSNVMTARYAGKLKARIDALEKKFQALGK